MFLIRVLSFVCLCVFACLHVSVNIQSLHVLEYVSLYANIKVRMYECIYACMHTRITECKSIGSFKKRLKTHLFKSAFN